MDNTERRTKRLYYNSNQRRNNTVSRIGTDCSLQQFVLIERLLVDQISSHLFSQNPSG
jgi:hypothetical protein